MGLGIIPALAKGHPLGRADSVARATPSVETTARLGVGSVVGPCAHTRRRAASLGAARARMERAGQARCLTGSSWNAVRPVRTSPGGPRDRRGSSVPAPERPTSPTNDSASAPPDIAPFPLPHPGGRVAQRPPAASTFGPLLSRSSPAAGIQNRPETENQDRFPRPLPAADT